jgi:hypothetical protein
VLEAADTVGAHLLDYGHVQLISPWRYNLDIPMVKRLYRHGWQEPDLDELPLARDIVEKVLKPFAALPEVEPFVHFRHRVVAVTRDGYDKVTTDGRDTAPFVIRVTTPDGAAEIRARAVIDSSGTWSTPNPLGANGLPATGVCSSNLGEAGVSCCGAESSSVVTIEEPAPAQASSGCGTSSRRMHVQIPVRTKSCCT